METVNMQTKCCNKKPVVFRKHENRSYCKQHFMESIEAKVRKTVGTARMISSHDRIAFALSGGKDSSVVLCIMHKFLKNRRDIGYFAVTIDEGIAGYRNKSLPVAKKLCKGLGIEHYICSYKGGYGKTLDEKVEEKRKAGERTAPCSFCGVARRHMLNKAAKELGATKLCVGHNLDDEVQSIIMNYLRGDLARASRIGTVTASREEGFIKRIKPLRFIPEKEVALYAYLAGLETQHEDCPYASGMRFDVRDFLNELENRYPGTKFAIIGTFEKIREGIRRLETPSGKLRPCEACSEPTSQTVCKACELWRY